MEARKKFFYCVGLLLTGLFGMQVKYIQGKDPNTEGSKRVVTQENNEKKVFKTVLDNGMTVLVYPTHTVPKVSLQVWYRVGSKDEEDGERGIAHLIEHMIFKGTQGPESLNLSESDINFIAHKLSGGINAFTTQDFTGYLFNMPTHHWEQALPILADCMQHASFKDDHLNSEMKAVIQELKMRKDSYLTSLAEAMLTAMFPDHPYHYPIIGYKQDLWNVSGKELAAFYKKHYKPNNATLVVVGDVKPDDVFEKARHSFSKIPADPKYKKKEFYHNKDLASVAITMHRDVKQPIVLLGFVVPGISSSNRETLDILSLVLGDGKASRLYQAVVEDAQLATSLITFHWGTLFDYNVFFIEFEPKELTDTDKIINIIEHEIADIRKNGVSEKEVTRAVKQARMSFYSLLENTQAQAFDIAKYYLATGDENYTFKYLTTSIPQLQKNVQKIITDYLRPSVMHVGKIVPIAKEEKKNWGILQEESDALDKKILSKRVRTTTIEPPYHLKNIQVKQPSSFNFPKADSFTLNNGLKVLYYHNGKTPKINLILRLKAQDYYDSEKYPGLYNFMTTVMTEGTRAYTAKEFADELESRGMSLTVSPGRVSMSMLAEDLPMGLCFLREVLMCATFPEKEIKKVREQLRTAIKNYWDNPSRFSGLLIREFVYKGHPYSKNFLGTNESINKIDRDNLIDFYKKFITPDGAVLSIVGDVAKYNLEKVFEKELGTWTGPVVDNIDFPLLKERDSQNITYEIDRDQVLLAFAALSRKRTDPNFDKLLLFDQILGGGVLGSMSSRLFELREQTGLFYSINGSLVSHADEQPGMVLVRTLVSVDRLAEAEKAILQTLSTIVDSVTKEEFERAKNAIINVTMQHFESNANIAQAFQFLEKYEFGSDYFDKRPEVLNNITLEDMQKAVRKVLHPSKLATFKIGRV